MLIFQPVTHFSIHVCVANLFSEKRNPSRDTSRFACWCPWRSRVFFVLNAMDVSKRTQRAPNPGNCSDAVLCLSIGLRAGSSRICNWLPSTLAALRLAATDGLKTAVTVAAVVGGDAQWFDALSLGSNPLTSSRVSVPRFDAVWLPSRRRSGLCWFTGQTDSGGKALDWIGADVGSGVSGVTFTVPSAVGLVRSATELSAVLKVGTLFASTSGSCRPHRT